MSGTRIAGLLVVCIAMGVAAACEPKQPPSWVDTCVATTRATREFCTCLDERRIVSKGRIAIGGSRMGSGGRIELPVYRDLSIDDEKICRNQILARIAREAEP